MPLVGFTCPEGVPTAGTQNDPDHCIYQCPHQCLPTAVLAKVWHDHQVNEHKGAMISPSMLASCPRKLNLERNEDYYDEPPKLYWAVRGSVIHGFLEDVQIRDTMKERRVYLPMQTHGVDWVISGRFDYLDISGGPDNACLEDYKTTHEKMIYFLFNDGAKKEHIVQTNIYRYLLRHGHFDAVDGPTANINVTKIRIHYLTMHRTYSTGSAVVERIRDMDKPRRPYKLTRSIEQDGVDTHGRPMWRMIIDLPDVPVWPDSEVEAVLHKHGPEMANALVSRPEQARAVWMEAKDNWQCRFCGPKPICDAIERRSVQLSLDI